VAFAEMALSNEMVLATQEADRAACPWSEERIELM